MKTKQIILRCEGCTVPNQEDLMDFILSNIDKADVHYLGRKKDYVVEDLSDHLNDHVLVNITFKSPVELDQSTAIEIVKKAVYEEKIERIYTNERDIEVFLY